jgi:hypothetical protein
LLIYISTLGKWRKRRKGLMALHAKKTKSKTTSSKLEKSSCIQQKQG